MRIFLEPKQLSGLWRDWCRMELWRFGDTDKLPAKTCNTWVLECILRRHEPFLPNRAPKVHFPKQHSTPCYGDSPSCVGFTEYAGVDEMKQAKINATPPVKNDFLDLLLFIAQDESAAPFLFMSAIWCKWITPCSLSFWETITPTYTQRWNLSPVQTNRFHCFFSSFHRFQIGINNFGLKYEGYHHSRKKVRKAPTRSGEAQAITGCETLGRRREQKRIERTTNLNEERKEEENRP
jgi:hypothetical protein